jgi:hypothetical protein
MTGMDETEGAQRARAAKADLAEILERRPDLKGKSVEVVRRLLRREARLSLRKHENEPGLHQRCSGGRFSTTTQTCIDQRP